jgi:hypothetical protein
MPAKEVEGKCEINSILNSNLDCNSKVVLYNISKKGQHLGKVCKDCVILTYDLNGVVNTYINWSES